MADAIQTAQGKPGSAMRVILIGTLAPSTGGWWHDLVGGGTNGTTYVQRLLGDVERWDKWSEIRRCNPLTAISPEFRAKLLDERDQGAARLQVEGSRFCSYRLNVPMGDEATMLLTVGDFEDMAARPVPERAGEPICAVDLGGSRAWSAALVIYPSGRIECLAVAPGLPSLADQERRDRVSASTYQRLHDAGLLHVAEGLRVPPASLLVEQITKTWGRPASIVCDQVPAGRVTRCSRSLPCGVEGDAME